jgi:hypothetical protein
MNHSFDIKLAEILGIEESILLQHIAFWIKINSAKGINFRNDKYWTFCSANSLVKIFPYINRLKITRTLSKLEEKEWLISGNFNKSSYDNTKWYTFGKKFIEFLSKDTYFDNLNLELPNFERDSENHDKMNTSIVQNEPSEVQNELTIPDINTDILKLPKGNRERASLTPPIKEKIPKIKSNWKQRMELVEYLTTKNGVGTDGGEKDLYMINHLANALAKKYTPDNWVSNVKNLINYGMLDPFHSKNMTNFGYIYRNWIKILKTHEEKDAGLYAKKKKEPDENCRFCNGKGIIEIKSIENGVEYCGVVDCECCKL